MYILSPLFISCFFACGSTTEKSSNSDSTEASDTDQSTSTSTDNDTTNTQTATETATDTSSSTETTTDTSTETTEPIDVGSIAAPLYAIEAGPAGSEFGFRVANVADMNGDGLSELALSGPQYVVEDFSAAGGAVALVLGGEYEDDIDPDGVHTLILAEDAYAYFGQSVTSCDTDNDGRPELYIGAPNQNYNGSMVGIVYRFELPLSGTMSAGSATSKFIGPLPFSSFGSQLSCNDGSSDVAISMSYFNSPTAGDKAGAVLLFDGAGSGEIGPSQIIAEIQGDHEGQQLGSGIAQSDINGDGVMDLLVSGCGEALNGFGSATMGVFYGPVQGNMSIADADERYNELTPGDSLGNTLQSADINQDGYADIVLSAYHESTNESRNGAVYIIHGSNQSLANLENADATFHGQTEYGYGGVSVAIIPDFSNDGQVDIAIGEYGARAEEGAENHGAVHLFLNNPSGTYVLEDADLTITGDGGSFGYHIASLDDTDGDQLNDLLVGAYLYGNDAGTALVFSGGNVE